MNNHLALNSKLKQYRSGIIDNTQLNSWIHSNLEEASSLLSRMAYLKLKQGDPTKAMIEILSDTCNCNQIFKEGIFSNNAEYELCQTKINDAKKSSLLISVKEPHFSKQEKNEIGAAGFYRCNKCGAFWKISASERSTRGKWKRIA